MGWSGSSEIWNFIRKYENSVCPTMIVRKLKVYGNKLYKLEAIFTLQILYSKCFMNFNASTCTNWITQPFPRVVSNAICYHLSSNDTQYITADRCRIKSFQRKKPLPLRTVKFQTISHDYPQHIIIHTLLNFFHIFQLTLRGYLHSELHHRIVGIHNGEQEPTPSWFKLCTDPDGELSWHPFRKYLSEGNLNITPGLEAEGWKSIMTVIIDVLVFLIGKWDFHGLEEVILCN